MGSSVTAFAASGQVADQQNNVFFETRVMDNENTDMETEQEIQILPSAEVDEEKWDNAVVYDDTLLDPLTVQKNFSWTVPPEKLLHVLLVLLRKKVVKSLFHAIFIRI